MPASTINLPSVGGELEKEKQVNGIIASGKSGKSNESTKQESSRILRYADM